MQIFSNVGLYLHKKIYKFHIIFNKIIKIFNFILYVLCLITKLYVSTMCKYALKIQINIQNIKKINNFYKFHNLIFINILNFHLIHIIIILYFVLIFYVDNNNNNNSKYY